MLFIKAIIKTIFPTVIDGDLLKLVHLSNGFRMVEGAKSLQIGDVCQAVACIVSITNASEGTIVKVKGHVRRDCKPVIEVVSSFLYRGRFTHDQNTFETTEEPDYLVELSNDAAVVVLQSKEWFVWDDNSKPLLAALLLSSVSSGRSHSKLYCDVSASGISSSRSTQASRRSRGWTSSKITAKETPCQPTYSITGAPTNAR
jgi:hypothetical protein